MYSIEQFPPEIDFETVAVLKKLASAHRYLAELKGICRSIPNQGILINTLSLQEAKDSSEIENIITPHDELFRAGISASSSSPAIKEVQNYASALLCGFDLIQKHGMLTNNHILTIQAELEKNRAGFRKQSGTMLKNDRTGETVYTPPQHIDDIICLMSRLEAFINNDNTEKPIDPLIRMALLHHQFESIHPFYTSAAIWYGTKANITDCYNMYAIRVNGRIGCCICWKPWNKPPRTASIPCNTSIRRCWTTNIVSGKNSASTVKT